MGIYTRIYPALVVVCEDTAGCNEDSFLDAFVIGILFLRPTVVLMYNFGDW
jgi:hypothetical protein